MVERGEISNSAGKTVLDELFANAGAKKETPEDIVKRLSLAQMSDEDGLKNIAKEIVAANPKLIEDYRNGKTNILGFLVGQCMKASKGKGNPQILTKLLKEIID